MWAARDKTNRLFLYYQKPKRRKTGWRIKGIPYLQLDKELFPELTWDDEPMEVTILPTSNLRHYIEDKIAEGIKKGLVKACKYGKGIN